MTKRVRALAGQTLGVGRWAARRPVASALAATGVALAVSALVNHRLARRTERRHPPSGKFVEVEGVRLHYIDRGAGPALVLLHGNGAMIADFASSGLIDLAARRYRVIVFDRPGFGHSDRPRATVWTAEAQAGLLHAALRRIGVRDGVVAGHSWGASVALALGLRHPDLVRALVLASGFYFPAPRIDFAILSAPAAPVLGAVLRTAVAPVIARLIWPLLLRKLFGPAPVPAKFAGFPREMAVRPSQIRATASETGLLVPMARAAAAGYRALRTPVVILAGAEDRLIDTASQSGRLHGTLAHSVCRVLPGVGHMVHQTRPDAFLSAIDEAAALAEERAGA